MRRNFKYSILSLILFSGLLLESRAQSVAIGGGDTTNRVTHKQTGSGHMQALDIPDSTGLYIYSNDGQKALRLYGSFRMLFVLDDRQQYQAFEIDPLTLPTGDADFENYNATWTPNMSRLGLDALFGHKDGKGILIRFETDWKGTSEKFRVRQLFMRTQNWVVGQTWTSFTTLEYLPQTVAGHMTGAASGSRVPQIRYYNKVNNWKYQLGLEYKTSSLIQPDNLGAVSRVIFPSLVGQFSYNDKWGKVGMGALLKPNRVQFTGEEKKVESIPGYGAMAAAKFHIRKSNRIGLSGYGGSGMASYIVDFTFVDSELAYNPSTTEFENMILYGGFLTYERDWSKTLSSTFAGGYNYIFNKDYQEDLAFNYSYKAMMNLFFKPVNAMKGLVMGAELLYVERFNKNETSNRALRASLLLYYDF